MTVVGITRRSSPSDPPDGSEGSDGADGSDGAEGSAGAESSDDSEEHVVRGFAVTIAALGIVFLVTLVPQLAPGFVPAWFRLQAQTYAVIWPQGWSFFSDAADTDQVAAYRLSDGGLGAAVQVQQVNASSSDSFGLSRTAMVTNNEIDYFAQEIPAGDWKACRAADVATCFSARGTALFAESDTFRPAALCGRVGFVLSASDKEGASRTAENGDAPMFAEALVSCS